MTADLPEQLWQFVGSMAALDRLSDTILLIRNVYVGDDPAAQYGAARAALEQAAARLGGGSEYRPLPVPDFSEAPSGTTINLTQAEFEQAVRTAIEYVYAGDVFQVVPSLRVEVPFDGDAFAVYRVLRLINPSPYLFFFRDRDVAIAGSSPEIMVRARGGKSVQPAHRRHPAPRGDSGSRPGARRGAAGRPQGAGRARHAGRPGPQRSRAGVGVRVGGGRRAHDHRAVLARHAHRLGRVGHPAARHRSGRGAAGDLPARDRHRRSQGAGDGDHRRARAVRPRPVRGCGRLHRLHRQPRYRHRPPVHGRQGGSGLGAGRRRRGGRLGSRPPSTRSRLNKAAAVLAAIAGAHRI